MKKSITIAFSVIISVIILLLMAAHFINTKDGAIRQKERNLLNATHIYDVITGKLNRALFISAFVAQDPFIIQILKNESQENMAQDINTLQSYCKDLSSSLNVATISVISENSHRYYNNEGLLKIIQDPNDSWYSIFFENNIQSSIGVYQYEQSNEENLLFVNVRITDKDGSFLGIASTSLYVIDFMDLIKTYENKYKIKINFVNNTGLVKLDSNFYDMGNKSLSYLVQKKNDTKDFNYMDYGRNGYAITKYIEEFDWYFVVRSNTDGASTQKLFYMFAVFLLLASFYVVYFTVSKIFPTKNAFPATRSQVDNLTGLPNRNFFKEMYGERGVFNTTRYKSLAVFDIDFFKEANDNMNGDEVLRSVVAIAQILLDNQGMVLRWGGDEFLVLFELPIENSYTICRQFCKMVASDGLVTVSVGLTEVRLSDTIKKNYYRAAQYCYQVKEMGGNGVKKD